METPICCYIDPATGQGCKRPATWCIVDGPAPDDYTEACDRHKEDLRPDTAHTVHPIRQEG